MLNRLSKKIILKISFNKICFIGILIFTSYNSFSQRRILPNQLATFYPTLGVEVSGGGFISMSHPDEKFFNEGYIGKLRYGVVGRYPLFKDKKFAFGLGLFYDERSMTSLKFDGFDSIVQLNSKHITLFPSIYYDRVFVGFNLGIPIATNVYSTLQYDVIKLGYSDMNFMIEPRIGSVLSNIINNKCGWLNLNFSVGCNVTRLLAKDVEICSHRLNGQSVSAHVGLSWQFAFVPQDTATTETKPIPAGNSEPEKKE